MFALRSGALVADLPGYGYAAVSRSVKRDWQAFLWQYVSTRNSLVALVLMIDARHGISDHDWPVLDAIVPTGRPVLILATKADKLNQAERSAAVTVIRAQVRDAFRGVSNVSVLAFSAVSRQGVDEADATLARWFEN